MSDASLLDPASTNGAAPAVAPTFHVEPTKRFDLAERLWVFLATSPLGRISEWALGRLDRQRLMLAHEFAAIARHLGGVREVWVRESIPTLELALVVETLDLERELELRGIFREVVVTALGFENSNLAILAESEGVPDSYRDGVQLI